MYKIILNINVKPKLAGLDSSLAILEIRLFLFFSKVVERSTNIVLMEFYHNRTNRVVSTHVSHRRCLFFKKTDSGLNSGSSVHGLTEGEQPPTSISSDKTNKKTKQKVYVYVCVHACTVYVCIEFLSSSRDCFFCLFISLNVVLITSSLPANLVIKM